jgi:hypothetical protein
LAIQKNARSLSVYEITLQQHSYQKEGVAWCGMMRNMAYLLHDVNTQS